MIMSQLPPRSQTIAGSRNVTDQARFAQLFSNHDAREYVRGLDNTLIDVTSLHSGAMNYRPYTSDGTAQLLRLAERYYARARVFLWLAIVSALVPLFTVLIYRVISQ